MKKLIIRSSFSKLPNGELKSNYGDLLRSSVLLECLGEEYKWITDLRASYLLAYFLPKDKILIFDQKIPESLSNEYIKIYNLDNFINNKSIFEEIKGEWHGFISDGNGHVLPENRIIQKIEPYSTFCEDFFWQQALVEGMGFDWKKQDYAPFTGDITESTDFGLNWHVHPKWESKSWSKAKWKELSNLLEVSNTVSWQSGLNDFGEYVNWISSCKVIITCDTLGFHLASALRKKVIALTGPTDSKEFTYGRIKHIGPNSRDCMPCNEPVCRFSTNCLDEIDARDVMKIALENLPN